MTSVYAKLALASITYLNVPWENFSILRFLSTD